MAFKKTALRFIVTLGLVSLFADMTYESARSIIGPFLSTLGASAAVVGAISGIAESAGYGFRGLFGYLSDKIHRYWLLVFIGYFINLIAIPLLAFAQNWQMAAGLMILEKIGKAIRVPPRDVLISYATKKTGRGWGFGVHEALDQIGAILGPLAIALLFLFKQDYQLAFALMIFPALISFAILIYAKISFPTPQHWEREPHFMKTKGFSKQFWLYISGVACLGLGFTNFTLISYHFSNAKTISLDSIPFLYGIVMGVDGLAALLMSHHFDKRGVKILALVTLLSALFSPFVFLGGFAAAVFGMLLWGIGLGAQESIMRAIIPMLVPYHKRGSGYGLLNFAFGVSWGLGNILMGFLYAKSLFFLVGFSLLMQCLAVPIFFSIKIAKEI